MDIIHLLPDSVANQIAAGEVIQRPASCLKELVENSLDAGAHHIRVIVRDAGRTMLQVVDDGSGMSTTDARMAFERHATSKIRTADDLMSLRTMGFRGEALASICAVAQVEVTTRREDDEVGTLLEIHGSEVVRQEFCQCAKGTSIKVKNLFYNVPVRRKFLKTDQTELRNLLTDFHHIVLVYPEVQFTFVHNDEVLEELTPGTTKQRIEQLFGRGSGRNYANRLLSIECDTDLVHIRGYVTKPEDAVRQPQQYFFVNGRYMRHPYFHKAIMQAYQGMLSSDVNPGYFIYFDMSPERIDVNIHPQKTEIKFQDEQPIFQILMAAVREALGKFSIAPTLDFDSAGLPEMPTVSTDTVVAPPTILVDPDYTPFAPQPRTRNHTSHTDDISSRGWEQLYRPADNLPPDTPFDEPTTEPELFGIDLEAVHFYAHNGYIFLPSPKGLFIVNQHRAHYAVLFEQTLSQMTDRPAEVQQLLFPEMIDLTPDDVALVEQIRDELQHIGFELDAISPTTYRISGVPSALQENAAEALRHILLYVRETLGPVESEWQRQIALSYAKASAISRQKQLSEPEIRDLLSQLFNLRSYLMTPDGKRIVALLLDEEIGRKFA